MLEAKRLAEDKWKDYRELRLEAFVNNPIAFGSAYEEDVRSRLLTEVQYSLSVMNYFRIVRLRLWLSLDVIIMVSYFQSKHEMRSTQYDKGTIQDLEA